MIEIDGWKFNNENNIIARKIEGDDLVEIHLSENGKYSAYINYIFYAEYEYFSEALKIADEWMIALC